MNTNTTTRINDSNVELAGDIIRKIRRRKNEIKDLENILAERESHRGTEAVEITFYEGMSYAKSVQMLSNNIERFVAALIPVMIGVLQAEIDSLYKEIDNL